MVKVKMNKKLIHFTDKHCQMIDVLMDIGGYSSISEVIRSGLSELYDKKGRSKSYNVDPLASVQTDVDKAYLKIQTKEEVEKRQAEVKRAKKISYCENIMHGKVVGDTCVYTQWGLKESDDSEEVCSLDHLESIITENDCFYYGKEATLNHRKDVVKLLNK